MLLIKLSKTKKVINYYKTVKFVINKGIFLGDVCSFQFSKLLCNLKIISMNIV